MTITPAAMPGAKPLGARMPPPPDEPDPVPAPVEDPLPPPPPAGAGGNTRFTPLYGIQYLRREAMRLAIEHYRDREPPSLEELLGTAARFATFIRNGR
jgi:hypothetical protein